MRILKGCLKAGTMNFFILDTFHSALVDMLTAAGHTCENVSHLTNDQIAQRLPEAEGILLRSRITLNRALIDRCPNLKLIGRVGAGLEHIDVDYARSKGIEVLSSPEGNRQAVAEHALALLLALFNNLVPSDREVRQGQWLRKQNEGIELQGKTVGVIGYGNTGAAFAKVVSGFGVTVLAYDKYKTGFGNDRVQETTMEEVCAKADVVSVHLPLTAETQALVSKDWIDRFARPIYLINTARGPIVNTADVLTALDDGRVLGACLDVLEFETENLKMPPLDELPIAAQRLFAHPKVILSPHTAGLTAQSYEKLSAVLAEKIVAFTTR